MVWSMSHWQPANLNGGGVILGPAQTYMRTGRIGRPLVGPPVGQQWSAHFVLKFFSKKNENFKEKHDY